TDFGSGTISGRSRHVGPETARTRRRKARTQGGSHAGGMAPTEDEAWRRSRAAVSGVTWRGGPLVVGLATSGLKRRGPGGARQGRREGAMLVAWPRLRAHAWRRSGGAVSGVTWRGGPLDHRKAAAHAERLSGDVGRIVRAEK